MSDVKGHLSCCSAIALATMSHHGVNRSLQVSIKIVGQANFSSFVQFNTVGGKIRIQAGLFQVLRERQNLVYSTSYSENQ